MTENANNRRDPEKNGRRATDNQQIKKYMSYPGNSLWGYVRNGIASAFVITALVGVGRASHTLDTAVKDVDENKIAIKNILEQNQELILVLKEQNIQQKESDKRFEEKFDNANEKLKNINDGVQKNRENIIILQNGKLSMRDKTNIIAMVD